MPVATERRPARFEWVPEHDATNGDIAVQVGEDLGLVPDADQRAILDAMFAYRRGAPHRPVAFEVGVVASRQNIKSSTLEVAALTDLFVFQEPLSIWTSHLFKSSKMIFKDLIERIDGNPEYRRKCRKPRTATGDEAIILATGEELQFHARSRGGGRSLTARRVTFDEALFLEDMHLGALLPTLATVDGAQVRYGSSAGLVGSAVLRAIRDRGRAGDDPRLAWFEWSAERRPCRSSACSHLPGAAGCALDDVALWEQSNPALGRRITLDTMRSLRRAMPPEEFAREFLGWWDDPPATETGPFALDAWLQLADPQFREQHGPTAFGVDVSVDRVVHVAVAWRRPDGRVQVMLVDDGTDEQRLGMSPLAAPARLNDLAARWKAPVVLGGTSLGMAVDVKGAIVTTSSEFASSTARFADLFAGRRVRHGNQRPLNEAVRAARLRPVGTAGERAIDLRTSPAVGPLAAVVRALHGVLAAPQRPPAAPVMEGRDRSQQRLTADWPDGGPDAGDAFGMGF